MQQNNGGNGQGPTISVGGPGGIQIGPGGVSAGNLQVQSPHAVTPQPFSAQPSQPFPAQSSQTVPTNQQSLDLSVPGQLLNRFGGYAAIGAGVLGVLMLGVPSAILSAVGAPIVLYAVAVGASLIPFTLAGVLGIRALKSRKRHLPDVPLESKLIHLATQREGRLTAVVAAGALSAPLREVEAALDDLVHTGHVSIDNDPQTGAVVYLFPGLDRGTTALPKGESR